MTLLGLVLSAIGLVLSITTASLATDALSPGVRLMAQAAPQPRGSDRLVEDGLSLPHSHRDGSNYLVRSKPRPTSSQQQIHGQVQSVHAPSLLFRADDGRVLTVDMSRVAPEVQRAIAPGEGATLIGMPGNDPNHFVAQRIQKDNRGADRLVEGGLSLPTANRYVQYDRSADQYVDVDVASVARRVERGQWIYDQTAGVWVNHPSVGGRNPLYVATSPSAGLEDRLVEGEWSLPRRHRYERYDRSADQYIEVDVANVPMRLDRGESIYDQTAGVWVIHPSGGRNPNYLAKSLEPQSSSGGSADGGGPTTTAHVDASQAARLQRVMVPLNRVMDHPVPLDKVKVGITNDPQINAGSGGGGQFFVTTGLLSKANDDQLRAILAHELAHQDLNHAGNAQVRNLGLSIGAAILGQIFPNSGAIAPLAGELVARSYGRDEEYAADRHGVELLRRAGYSKEMMINALTWLMQTSNSDSGGFFATHPGTGDRIEVLRNMP